MDNGGSCRKINGFLFGIEIIILEGEQGLKINEFPVGWGSDRDSRLSFTGSSLPIIKEIYQLRRRYKKVS